MSKKAIIVESPTKTRTLSRFLGDEYKLLATRGHVRDLPQKDLAVDVEHDFRPQYEIIPRQKKTLKQLGAELKGIEQVYLASDPDREGEAIAWHLTQALELPAAQRIEFNEITEEAVRQALAHPRAIDMQRVEAQQARRLLDRLVGYQISPILWRRLGRRQGSALSAGRVQSVALRLIVEREREIVAFVPEEYWTISATLTPPDEEQAFTAELKEKDGEKIEIKSEEEAQATVADLQQQEFVVGDTEEKDRKRNPYPPFITSTLQRGAAAELHFSASKTMRVAQQLYEGVALEGETVGLITYMRTDSTRVAASAQQQAREYIGEQFGEKYVGKGVRGKKAKGAQEAHECIRPTSVLRTPDQVRSALDQDQARLYELIWRRFIASQMTPAIYHHRNADIIAGPYLLRAGSSQVVFPGFLKVMPDKKGEQAAPLPELTVGQILRLLGLESEQHFTQPPPRYTEASLVQVLEEKGIGRPSTYAPIIETLRQRKYVQMSKRQFVPTRLGVGVCDYLLDHFPDIMEVEFTARMEEDLDTVEQGKRDWVQLLHDFYDPFAQRLEQVQQEKLQVLEGEKCPECGGKLLIRYSAMGKFAGCEKYPECSYTRDLSGLPQDEEKEPPQILEEKCPQCDSPLVVRQGRRGRFIGCSGYPKCRYTRDLEPQAGETAPAGEHPQETEEKCPQCGAPLVQRRSRRGPFIGCSAFPKCRYIRSLDGEKPRALQTDISCEKCGKPLVLRTGKRGKFLGCSGFPRCRFTREVTPEEMERIEAPAAATEEGGE